MSLQAWQARWRRWPVSVRSVVLTFILAPVAAVGSRCEHVLGCRGSIILDAARSPATPRGGTCPGSTSLQVLGTFNLQQLQTSKLDFRVLLYFSTRGRSGELLLILTNKKRGCNFETEFFVLAEPSVITGRRRGRGRGHQGFTGNLRRHC